MNIAILLSLGIAFQAAPADDLKSTVLALDARLFEAYNNAKVEALGEMVADDLEFYQDTAGLSKGREVFLANYKRYINGAVKRVLVKDSVVVCPLKGFGAIEMGTHRFFHPGKGADEQVGEAKFLMIWKNDNGKWTLTRVVSYDHGTAK